MEWKMTLCAIALATTAAGCGPRGGKADFEVFATAETEAVSTEGDTADDPAIWVHPEDVRLSLIVGSQKKFGLLVYDLSGKLLQSIPAGRINNVDVRDGFALGDKTVAIVAGSNRSNRSIALYAIDHATRQLSDIADGVQDAGMPEPYGLCLYHSAVTDRFYVFVNDKSGPYRQGELIATESGRVRIEWRREFRLDTQPEGCVADDELGVLYAGEEDVGVWRLGAEPGAGADKQLVDKTGRDGHLVADVEGMSLWTDRDGGGYLIVSSQGENAYNIYSRKDGNAYLGKFRIVDNADKTLDGSSETDGLDVTSADLGGAYAQGLLVVQDGKNTRPAANQNFKLVPWSAVAEGIAALKR